MEARDVYGSRMSRESGSRSQDEVGSVSTTPRPDSRLPDCPSTPEAPHSTGNSSVRPYSQCLRRIGMSRARSQRCHRPGVRCRPEAVRATLLVEHTETPGSSFLKHDHDRRRTVSLPDLAMDVDLFLFFVTRAAPMQTDMRVQPFDMRRIYFAASGGLLLALLAASEGGRQAHAAGATQVNCRAGHRGPWWGCSWGWSWCTLCAYAGARAAALWT